MHSAIYCTKAAELDEAAYAVLRNRELYIAASAATVGRMAAHPPVPRSKSMIPVSTVAAGTLPSCVRPPLTPRQRPPFLDLCDDREPDLPCGYTAPTHYLEF